MVGFCDLVGTGIAPVSTKTAVNAYHLFSLSRNTMHPMKIITIKLLILKLNDNTEKLAC